MRRLFILVPCLFLLLACDDDAAEPAQIGGPRLAPGDDASAPNRDAGRDIEACGPCAVGEARCDGERRAQTCEAGDDGCARWGTPTLCAQADERCVGAGRCCVAACGECAADERCVVDGDGCAACATEAPDPDPDPPMGCGECTVGERECLDETRFLGCAEFEAGCVRWSEPVDCPGGTTCAAGDCTRPCTHACANEGERVCHADGRITECRADATGCRAEVDVGGCVAGERDCNDAATYRVCAADADGCFGWRVEPCADGVRCFEDPVACVGGCPDACEAGAVMCRAGPSYAVCEQRGACPTWSVRACEGGADCARQTDACLGRCPRVCDLGAQRCAAGGRFERCERGDDGCPAWVTRPCVDGDDCEAAPDDCFGGCVDECVEGGWGCLDEGYRECVRMGRCARWVERPCADDAVCWQSPRACRGECDHACEADARECTEQGYRQCEVDFEGCRVWRDRFCFDGADCAEAPARCFGECEGFGCQVGEKRCSGNETYEVCEADEVGCTAWVERPCEQGDSCFNARAACFGDCADACEEGARECAEGALYRECQRDFFDGCTEWVDRNCFGGVRSCAETPPACFGDCRELCEPGDARCWDIGSYQRCERPEGGCAEWSEPLECADPEANCFGDPAACAGE